ncbi:MAG: stage V sporulation protein AE [Bacilli bacterium]|nr:stage V sporulation protein AE [Bacilli bacterium]
MLLFYSFLFCGFICLIGQIILDNTKLTPGHITSMFVVIGVLLDTFNIYDKIIKVVGGGASLPITSFGHLLVHGALSEAKKMGIIGIFNGVLKFCSAGIVAAILFSFIFTIIFKPRD